MLTKHSVLLNKIRNEKYKRCQFRCNNLAEFEEPLRPSKVVSVHELVNGLGLEGVERQCEYYSSALVGRHSVYFKDEQRNQCDFVEDRENFRLACDMLESCDSFDFDFTPVQLELF